MAFQELRERLAEQSAQRRRNQRALLGLALRAVVVFALSLWLVWTLYPRLRGAPRPEERPQPPPDTVTFSEPEELPSPPR